MEDSKEKIIKLFFENVYGKTPTINNYNSNHAGAKGHWLEIQLGKEPDSSNDADFWGWECKDHTTSGKTTYGDWTANEYIFDRNNKYGIDRNDFLKFWGKPNKEKNNRLSWSGEHVPTYANNKNTVYGQAMSVDQDLNIIIKYNFSKDQRNNKYLIIPQQFQSDEIILAKWYGLEKNNISKKTALKTKVENKFNNLGWFKCVMEDNVYTKIIFGKTIDFDTWIENVKLENIFFDSGMYEGNKRPYSQWRSNNSFWDQLVTDVYP